MQSALISHDAILTDNILYCKGRQVVIFRLNKLIKFRFFFLREAMLSKALLSCLLTLVTASLTQLNPCDNPCIPGYTNQMCNACPAQVQVQQVQVQQVQVQQVHVPVPQIVPYPVHVPVAQPVPVPVPVAINQPHCQQVCTTPQCTPCAPSYMNCGPHNPCPPIRFNQPGYPYQPLLRRRLGAYRAPLESLPVPQGPGFLPLLPLQKSLSLPSLRANIPRVQGCNPRCVDCYPC